MKKSIKASQAKSFLDSLVYDSNIYKNIFDTDTRKWSKNELCLKKSLDTLSNFGVTQQTSMVLSVMREYSQGNLKFKYAREALEAIVHFHFIFTAITSQRSSGSIATMYSSSARKLVAASDDSSRLAVIRELRQKMREKLPTFDEFYANFKIFKFTNGFTKQKKTIFYILSKFDGFYNRNAASIHYDLMTIEHILPQNPTSSMKLPNQDEYVGLIGNLILVSEEMNNNLGTKSFPEKQFTLQSSSVYVDEKIVNATNWTESEIEARTLFIAQKAYNEVFKI